MKTNKNVSLSATLFILPIELVSGVPVLLFAAYVMVEIWGWWGVPYGFAPLPFWTAVAIDLMFSIVRGPTRDYVGTAEVEAIYEEAGGDFEYILGTLWWSLKRRLGVAFSVLMTWGAAFFLHRVIE